MKMNKTVIELGQFEITSGEAFVSDPCYEVGTWCQAKLANVKNGHWFASVFQSDEGDWGIRNAELIAYHESAQQVNELDWKLEDAEIGVDSGQAGIYDAISYRNDSMVGEIENKLGFDLDEEGEKFYAQNCDLTVDTKPFAGVLGHGVVSSSGYGDGGYNLYTIKDNDGEIVAMKVIFIGDEDEEDFIEEEEF